MSVWKLYIDAVLRAFAAPIVIAKNKQLPVHADTQTQQHEEET